MDIHAAIIKKLNFDIRRRPVYSGLLLICAPGMGDDFRVKVPNVP